MPPDKTENGFSSKMMLCLFDILDADGDLTALTKKTKLKRSNPWNKQKIANSHRRKKNPNSNTKPCWTWKHQLKLVVCLMIYSLLKYKSQFIMKKWAIGAAHNTYLPSAKFIDQSDLSTYLAHHATWYARYRAKPCEAPRSLLTALLRWASFFLCADYATWGNWPRGQLRGIWGNYGHSVQSVFYDKLVYNYLSCSQLPSVTHTRHVFLV